MRQHYFFDKSTVILLTLLCLLISMISSPCLAEQDIRKPILQNKRGDTLNQFIATTNENDIAQYSPATHALLIIKYKGKYLIVYDKNKRKWELSGGKIEKGETPRQCAIRELKEETGQSVSDIRLKGTMKFILTPDRRIEYGALYMGSLKHLVPFKENNEISEILFWDGKMTISNFDAIDQGLVELYGK